MNRTFIYKLLLLLITVLAVLPAIGQEDGFMTRVNLNDGSVIEGRLVEYVDGEYVRLNIGDNEITIKQSSIKNIKHFSRTNTKTYAFRETGMYNHTSFGLLPGFISAGNPALGMAVDHSVGYMFNRTVGAGLNIGITNYSAPISKEVFYSVAGEFRGYLLGRYLSPYYRLGAGYGFTHAGETFEEANGGFFLIPAIGFRLTGKKFANITTEIGLCFQDAYFKQQATNWWNRSLIEKDVRYQRFTIKFGLLF
jgi:hypothetical protein